jgi:hypothetical protein
MRLKESLVVEKPRTDLHDATLAAALTVVLLAACLLITPQTLAAGIVVVPRLNTPDNKIVHTNYHAETSDPWGHHNGRYNWNHYWTLAPVEIYAPPRPWRWSSFTKRIRPFPHAVPYNHMARLFGSWTYDYRANAIHLINLFPDFVIRRVTEEPRKLHFAAYRRALDAEIGETFNWSAGNIRGSITTTRVGRTGRRYCREFRQDIFIDERPQQAMGTVCRSRGGEWEIAPNQ